MSIGGYDATEKSFNSHGSYSDMAGIAVYRAIRKISPKNSGSNIYYEEFDDSVNYVVEDGVLTAYNGACSKIEIPDGVTEIAAGCFKNKTFIKYVYMPDTVTTIGSTCFFGCTSLQYVQFSNIVSLSSENYIVQVKDGMWLYGRSTGSAVITAKTASSGSFTFTAYSKPVASVSVTPAQISGSLGENLNTSGLCVTAAFSDGTSCPVTYYTLSGYSSRTEGERSVTVRYGDKSCTLTVNVSQAPASGTLGDTLRWRFDPQQNTLAFSGTLPQNAQILVASYESSGKLLETQLIQTENAVVSLRPGAAKIKCFLVNDAFIPLCREANIQEL